MKLGYLLTVGVLAVAVLATSSGADQHTGRWDRRWFEIFVRPVGR